MIFLKDSDFEEMQVRNEVLNVLKISTTSLDTGELVAMETVSSSIKTRFDAAATFAARDEARNPLIVMYMIDIILYHLHSNTPSRVVPKNREDRFNAANTWLNGVNGGSLIPSLPPIEAPEKDPLFRFGSSGTQQSKRW